MKTERQAPKPATIEERQQLREELTESTRAALIPAPLLSPHRSYPRAALIPARRYLIFLLFFAGGQRNEGRRKARSMC